MDKNFFIKILITALIVSGLLIVIVFVKNDHPKKVLSINTSPASSNPSPLAPSPSKTVSKHLNYQVPILMYHYIRIADPNDQMGVKLSVSPKTFEDQLMMIKNANYVSVRLKDLADPEHSTISNIYANGKKPIIFTFDDGYEDAYTSALPLLLKYGFHGTFFIIINYLDQKNYLTDDQVKKLSQNEMEIGSHTLDHPDLTKISENLAQKEIVQSKNNYQTFCYPSGKYNLDIALQVKDAGYLVAVTTKNGVANENSNLFELPRIRVENISGKALIAKINYAQQNGN